MYQLSLLRQISEGLPGYARRYERILSEVLAKPVPPLGWNIMCTMQGLSLAAIANRIDEGKERDYGLIDYAKLTGMASECERLISHPLIPQYTVCISTLSYYAWRDYGNDIATLTRYPNQS